MIEIIYEYIALWMPSIVGILGMVSMLLAAIFKVKDALHSLSSKEGEMIDSQKELVNKLSVLINENQELSRINKILTDKIARIEGYTDAIFSNEEKK